MKLVYIEEKIGLEKRGLCMEMHIEVNGCMISHIEKISRTVGESRKQGKRIYFTMSDQSEKIIETYNEFFGIEGHFCRLVTANYLSKDLKKGTEKWIKFPAPAFIDILNLRHRYWVLHSDPNNGNAFYQGITPIGAYCKLVNSQNPGFIKRLFSENARKSVYTPEQSINKFFAWFDREVSEDNSFELKPEIYL